MSTTLLPHAIDATALLSCILLVVLYISQSLFKAWVTRSKLSHIPTIGPSGVLSSYAGAYKLLFHARETIQEGYNKYYGTAFKVPMVSSWLIIVSGPKMIDDLRRATGEYVSFREAVAEGLQTDYTVGSEIRVDPYHVATVRTSLTKSLGVRFPDVQDEIEMAFAEFIPATDKWIKVPALKTATRLICRSSNRLFVGLPLCRNSDYNALTQDFAAHAFQAGFTLNLFPKILRPIAARIFTNVPASIRRAMVHLGPLIQERLDKAEQYGPDWPGKPNDLISWLLEDAQGHQRTIRDLTIRVLSINFAAIHAMSLALTKVLFDIASNPSYVPALREEVQLATGEGLSRSTMDKMRKMDSFIKESQRMGGVGGLGMMRKILKDFTFSDGTFVPAGSTVSVAGFSTHHDAGNYPNPDVFDGYRFLRMRESEEDGAKHQMVSLGLDYITFGNGRYACPGRFFAVNELKAMLAHVLMHYDVKLENNVRPPDRWFGVSAMPDPTATVMFRKRFDHM